MHGLIHQHGHIVEHALSRTGDDDVNTWPTEFRGGNDLDTNHLVATVPDRSRSQQIKNLRLDDAFMTHGLVAPDHEGYFLWIFTVLGEVIGQHLVCQFDA